MTKRIYLTQGKFTLVDDDVFEQFGHLKWAYSKGYVLRSINETRLEDGTYRVRGVILHRLILDAPKDRIVDHINGNTLDNRRKNLRLASYSQNAANSGPRPGSSQYKGVSWRTRNKIWKASIRIDDKYVCLGLFDCERRAALAYDQAAYRTWGEFAYLNFPQEI